MNEHNIVCVPGVHQGYIVPIIELKQLSLIQLYYLTTKRYPENSSPRNAWECANPKC